MRVVRTNAWTEISGADPVFAGYLSRHLSVPVDVGTKRGKRFGGLYQHEGEFWGTLVQRTSDMLFVPAGLTGWVIALAKRYGRHGELIDARVRPETGYPWHCVNGVEWRPYQNEIHERIVQEGTGVIVALPRSGKTLMAARAVDVHALPTVYVAPSVSIVRQTHRVFCEHFGDDMVGRLDGESKDIDKPIVISTAISAARQSREWWATRQMLIIDEFHHSAAETYHVLNDLAAHIYYRLCFTGTHFRSGSDALAMHAVCSRVLREVTLDELVPRYLARPFAMFHRYPFLGRVRHSDWASLYKHAIVENDARNDKVVEITHRLLDEGSPTIVLVKRRAHADKLGKLISDSVVVKGGEGALTSKAVRDFEAGRYQVLIGTTVIGEGVDVPRASALVYASGGGDGVAHAQSYFRPLTARDGKEFARIIDFVDAHHRTLENHTQARYDAATRLFGASQVSRVD